MKTVNPYESPKLDNMTPPVGGKLPVRAEGTLVPGDAIAAMRIAGVGRVFRRFVCIGCCIGLSVAVVLFIFNYRATGVVVGFISVYAMAQALLGSRDDLRRAWHVRREYREPMVWTFRDEGLLVQTISSTEEYAWNEIINLWLTGEQIVMICKKRENSVLIFVPRRFFEFEQQWMAVKEWLAAKLPILQSGSQP